MVWFLPGDTDRWRRRLYLRYYLLSFRIRHHDWKTKFVAQIVRPSPVVQQLPRLKKLAGW